MSSPLTSTQVFNLCDYSTDRRHRYSSNLIQHAEVLQLGIGIWFSNKNFTFRVAPQPKIISISLVTLQAMQHPQNGVLGKLGAGVTIFHYIDFHFFSISRNRFSKMAKPILSNAMYNEVCKQINISERAVQNMYSIYGLPCKL